MPPEKKISGSIPAESLLAANGDATGARIPVKWGEGSTVKLWVVLAEDNGDWSGVGGE